MGHSISSNLCGGRALDNVNFYLANLVRGTCDYEVAKRRQVTRACIRIQELHLVILRDGDMLRLYYLEEDYRFICRAWSVEYEFMIRLELDDGRIRDGFEDYERIIVNYVMLRRVLVIGFLGRLDGILLRYPFSAGRDALNICTVVYDVPVRKIRTMEGVIVLRVRRLNGRCVAMDFLTIELSNSFGHVLYALSICVLVDSINLDLVIRVRLGTKYYYFLTARDCHYGSALFDRDGYVINDDDFVNQIRGRLLAVLIRDASFRFVHVDVDAVLVPRN